MIGTTFTFYACTPYTNFFATNDKSMCYDKSSPQQMAAERICVAVTCYFFSKTRVFVHWSHTSVGPQYWMGPGYT